MNIFLNNMLNNSEALRILYTIDTSELFYKVFLGPHYYSAYYSKKYSSVLRPLAPVNLSHIKFCLNLNSGLVQCIQTHISNCCQILGAIGMGLQKNIHMDSVQTGGSPLKSILFIFVGKSLETHYI